MMFRIFHLFLRPLLCFQLIPCQPVNPCSVSVKEKQKLGGTATQCYKAATAVGRSSEKSGGY